MANIDAMKILGSLLSSGALSRGSGGNVLGSVIGAMTGGGRQAGASTTGGLGDLVGSVLGGGRSGGGMRCCRGVGCRIRQEQGMLRAIRTLTGGDTLWDSLASFATSR